MTAVAGRRSALLSGSNSRGCLRPDMSRSPSRVESIAPGERDEFEVDPRPHRARVGRDREAFRMRRLLSLAHLVAPDALDDLGICLCPSAEILDRERQLDVREAVTGSVRGSARRGAQMALHERLLCFGAPEVLEERLDDRA